jgi:hypothetical protein
MKEIKDYSYSINCDILEIFIKDLEGNEITLATSGNITEEEADNIAQEVIEGNGYILQ